jgi:hypothetical protein
MAWDGKFTGSMKKRADKPNHRAQVKTEYYGQFKSSDATKNDHTLKLAYHHITDWAKLRDVWNKLIDDRHFSTICIWLYAAGFDTRNYYYETEAPQTPFGITRAIMDGSDVQKVADADEIHARITWSTWNLVEGPEGAIRTGDEGNFHDIFSNCAGLNDDERADLQAADRVYTAMAALNLSGTIQKERASALSKALLGVNRNAQVIKFREDMWTHQNHGPTRCTSKCWTKSER